MVDIRIIVEGGIVPHQNDSAATINSSEKLREGFHKLLSQIVSPDSFNLIIELKGGFDQATQSFREYASINQNTSLVLDLDDNKSTKERRLCELKIENYADRVFFMVQEMEAWILSQPNVIEKCYRDRYIRKKINVQIAEEKVFKIHPEEIIKPSEKLKVIIARYYSEMKGNVLKKKKYNKLKDAALLMEHLDMNKLIETFEDLKLLKNHILK